MDATTNKLFTRGAEALSDNELLSLLLDDGKSIGNGDDMAAKLLAECRSLTGVARTDIARLRMVEGVGLKRALRIVAAAELGKRIMAAEADRIDYIVTGGDVARIFRPQFERLRHEECWALYLTSSNRIIERQRVSQGGVQGTVVDNRLIVKRALELLAVQVILVHNHPSGNAAPSQQDIDVTQKLEQALALFDIRLLDHIIIGGSDEFGFRHAQLLAH